MYHGSLVQGRMVLLSLVNYQECQQKALVVQVGTGDSAAGDKNEKLCTQHPAYLPVNPNIPSKEK